ncbi:predicted protein [Sclerotinia sclerotiorum 1980 UF-70]|uniref:Ubiquitin-like domain-containing protein n=2 Tax=Sclerotinia sclerotiorum (strain ATCC 18683 / 1980 / Ss-1) TaxID=665079 RepID=A7EZP4_SCLS1|nr:predicted protein [Sclerotinia sclerotiorum 1980 UF-70]APA12204.1 hypothetical protein sscle_09g069740 [Sclerotinia sclerotiorum 1980 UF-70]EDN94936.1 predicted protein [Sclerotinia sclerotiorum 1980 UF-70]
MTYNTFQSNDFQGGHDDDSSLLAETYRPCKTLYISTTTDTHTLLNLSPSSRISFVKETFIISVFDRNIIPHRDYECAFSYAGRELTGDETLESCQIGDEATVNAVVWTLDLTLHKGLKQENEDASSMIGRDDEQKTKRSERVKSALGLSDPDEDMEQSNLLLQLGPVTKKRKVRFADEIDVVSPPQTPFHIPSTSKFSGPQGYSMSGGLGQGSKAIHFHDTLVQNATKYAFPQTGSLGELPPPKHLKPTLKYPPPFDIYTGQEKSFKPVYDSLGNLIAQKEVSQANCVEIMICRQIQAKTLYLQYGTPCIFNLRELDQYLNPYLQRRLVGR